MTSNASTPLPRLPLRSADSHKGDFGRALLIGGSPPMSGAIGLAAMAALRSGCGLVTAAAPAPCAPIVASYEPCYMSAPLPADEEGRICLAARETIDRLAADATCMACGPGMGRSKNLTTLIKELYSKLDRPMVVDADALNALAEIEQGLPVAPSPRILTPHPEEFRRLLQHQGPAEKHCSKEQPTRESLEESAIEFARDRCVIIVLKGRHTLITNGARSIHNTTGNPGMATGGSGDVLTGVITALVCQGMTLLDAAHLGAHVHGLAGDLAAQEKGHVGLIARDLIDFLPQAFLTVEKLP